MINKKLKFGDFQIEKLSKNQQKTVRGGDGIPPVTSIPLPLPIDPGKGGGTTAG